MPGPYMAVPTNKATNFSQHLALSPQVRYTIKDKQGRL